MFSACTHDEHRVLGMCQSHNWRSEPFFEYSASDNAEIACLNIESRYFFNLNIIKMLSFCLDSQSWGSVDSSTSRLLLGVFRVEIEFPDLESWFLGRTMAIYCPRTNPLSNSQGLRGGTNHWRTVFCTRSHCRTPSVSATAKGKGGENYYLHIPSVANYPCFRLRLGDRRGKACRIWDTWGATWARAWFVSTYVYRSNFKFSIEKRGIKIGLVNIWAYML